MRSRRQHLVSSPRRDELSTRPRAGFVRFQQELAREALLRGSLGAARVALRVLTPDDFAEDEAAMSKRALAFLRDTRADEDAVLEALRVLIALCPAGMDRLDGAET